MLASAPPTTVTRTVSSSAVISWLASELPAQLPMLRMPLVLVPPLAPAVPVAGPTETVTGATTAAWIASLQATFGACGDEFRMTGSTPTTRDVTVTPATGYDGTGRLILSEFSGAAADLGEADLVNPYDIEAVKDALAAAVDVGTDSNAMVTMRRRLRRHDAAAWARGFLSALCGPVPVSSDPRPAEVGR